MKLLLNMLSSGTLSWRASGQRKNQESAMPATDQISRRNALLIPLALPTLFSFTPSQAHGQSSDSPREPAFYAGIVQARAASATTYTFDAVVEVSRKTGEEPRESVAKFQLKHAVAPGGKYLLRVGDKQNLQYLIVSDGLKTWAYSPRENQYAEIEVVASRLAADPGRAFPAGVTPDSADPVLCSALVLPVLARLEYGSAAVVDLKQFGDGSVSESELLSWLTVLSGKPDAGSQNLTEITLNTQTFQIRNLNWSKATDRNEERTFTLLNADFTEFRLNEAVPASYFVFEPGDAAKVESLSVPGLYGGPMIDKQAPDFRLETSDRKVVTRESLRGRPALLAFSGNECTACSKQASALSAFARGAGAGKIVVLDIGANRADLHSLFRVQFLPTAVLIDGHGVIKRYVPGVLNEAQLGGLVKSA